VPGKDNLIIVISNQIIKKANYEKQPAQYLVEFGFSFPRWGVHSFPKVPYRPNNPGFHFRCSGSEPIQCLMSTLQLYILQLIPSRLVD